MLQPFGTLHDGRQDFLFGHVLFSNKKATQVWVALIFKILILLTADG
jgi:hypothetical protein